MKITFKDKSEFGDYIRKHKPLEIWWDVFSTDIPYITIDSYDKTMLRGAYTRQCFLSHYLINASDLFKEGMYIKQHNEN